jgi:hypothetical protein
MKSITSILGLVRSQPTSEIAQREQNWRRRHVSKGINLPANVRRRLEVIGEPLVALRQLIHNIAHSENDTEPTKK